jgi:hypothetical protein
MSRQRPFPEQDLDRFWPRTLCTPNIGSLKYMWLILLHENTQDMPDGEKPGHYFKRSCSNHVAVHALISWAFHISPAGWPRCKVGL